MPHLTCQCGTTLRYGEIPCEIEWLLFRHTDLDKLPAAVETEALYRQSNSLAGLAAMLAPTAPQRAKRIPMLFASLLESSGHRRNKEFFGPIENA